jgi:aspartyl-tRNA(Asn)/glutamyl-tRNA(Gln) amidotransferase subunit C
MELRDLQETAELARLNMGDEELRGALPAFEEMLSFFAAMQEAESDGGFSPSLNFPAGMAAHARLVDAAWFRADGGTPASRDDLSQQILSRADGRDGRFVVIPNVL